MSRRRKSAKEKGVLKFIANERVETLLKLAHKEFKSGDEHLARKYCNLARKIQLRYRIRLKKELSLKYCKKCFIPWIVGRTMHAGINSRKKCVEYACACGYVKRFGYNRNRGV